MKMKKMVGALALSAALAMGTAPAFAAAAEPEGATSDTGSTEVKAKVDKVDTQVRAVVPLQVTVVFGPTGASDITGPTAGAYAIENIGEGDIKVTEAEITDMHKTFTSEAIYEDSGSWFDSSDNPITAGNYIMFTYNTAGNNTYLTVDHPLSDALAKASNKVLNDEAYVDGAKTFSEETIAVGDKMGINLAGKAYFKDTLDGGEMTDTLCKIKYTIAAA